MIRILFLILFAFFALNTYSIDYVYKAGYGIVVNWEKNDKVGVFAESDTQAGFEIQSVETTDAHIAKCYGFGKRLMNGKKYFSMSPYNYDYYANDNISTALPIEFPVLKQTENGSVKHLAQSDYMIANVMTTDEADATFSYNHLGCILRMNVMVPEDAEFVSACIETENYDFLKTGVLNIETEQIKATELSNSVEMALGNINVKRGDKLQVFFALPATNLQGKQVLAKFESSNGKVYVCSFNGYDFQPGSMYNVERTLKAVDSKLSAKLFVAKLTTNEDAILPNRHKAKGVVEYPTCEAKDFKLANNDISYEPLPPLFILGDVNQDEKVDIADLDLISNYILGFETDVFSFKAADVNKDGRINIGDIPVIINMIK